MQKLTHSSNKKLSYKMLFGSSSPRKRSIKQISMWSPLFAPDFNSLEIKEQEKQKSQIRSTKLVTVVSHVIFFPLQLVRSQNSKTLRIIYSLLITTQQRKNDTLKRTFFKV